MQNCRWLHKPMTSFRQVEANQGKALRSTGPKTEASQPAVGAKCGSARVDRRTETVVVALEDINKDYQAFEAAIIADYDARSRRARAGAAAISASRPPAAPRFGTSALRSGGWSHYHRAVLCDAIEL
jgi:hypothetical protein